MGSGITIVLDEPVLDALFLSTEEELREVVPRIWHRLPYLLSIFCSEDIDDERELEDCVEYWMNVFSKYVGDRRG